MDPWVIKQSNMIFALYATNALINIPGILMNICLIVVTLRNRRLHSTCSLLIGFCSMCTILLLSQHFIPFVSVALPKLEPIPMLTCYLVHLPSVYGVFNAISVIGAIGLDRLLSVFLPFWYLQRNEALGLATLIALSSLFPLFILALMLQNALAQPALPLVCTLYELLADKTSLVAGLCLLCNLASVLCYLAVWTKLKWDLRKSRDHRESISSRQPIFRSLMFILCIQVGGWCISEAAFALIFLKMEASLQQRYLAAAVNCFICVVASTDPVVLFCTSEEYRKAFCEQFLWLQRIGQKMGPISRAQGASVAVSTICPVENPRIAWNATTRSTQQQQ